MIDISDRVPKSLADKIVSAEVAAEYFKDGMTIGASGFTPSGYPKAVPLAIAERMKKSPSIFGQAHPQVPSWTARSPRQTALSSVCPIRRTRRCAIRSIREQ